MDSASSRPEREGRGSLFESKISGGGQSPHIDFLKVVGFTLGPQEFVVNILQVKEIKLMMTLTPIPKSIAYLQGVANLRGEIIPVINLRRKLNLPPVEATEDTRVVVVELESKMVGIIVDSVTEVHLIPVESISAPPSALGGVNVQLIRGAARVGERLLVFLDIDKILSPDAVTSLGFHE